MSQSTLSRAGAPHGDDDETRFEGELVLTHDAAARPRQIHPGPVAAAAGTASFVALSTAIATMPLFAEVGQLSAALPLFLWVAAPGLGPAATWVGEIVRSWRAGLLVLLPYALTLFVDAAVPGLAWPWWIAPAAGLAAAVPFAAMARDADSLPRAVPQPGPELAGGTLFAGVALMLMTFGACLAGDLWGALAEVLLAVALGCVSLRVTGLANAASRWRPRHWLALTWGSVVVWASAALRSLDAFVAAWWAIPVAMVLAGLPLVLLRRTSSSR